MTTRMGSTKGKRGVEVGPRDRAAGREGGLFRDANHAHEHMPVRQA